MNSDSIQENNTSFVDTAATEPAAATVTAQNAEDGTTEAEGIDINCAEAERIIEAVLFAAGHPIEYPKLAALFAGATAGDAKRRVAEIAERYNSEERGVMLLTLDYCAQLCTREEYAPFIRQALGIRRGGNLSNSSMETLSVIAYNQPVTRVYIDSVRGVDSSYAVSSLLERGLIEVVGRLDQPGRPMLYGTTPDFLRAFGLSSVRELPEVAGAEGAPALLNITIDDVLAESDGADNTESAPTGNDTNDSGASQ